MTTKTTALVGAILCASAFLAADEGRIPLYTATTISQAGYYVVTRDFSQSGSAITVAHSDVTIDLNGRTLTNTGAGAVVNIQDGSTNITVRNGRLVGGTNGVYYSSPSDNRIRIVLESLQVESPSASGFWIQDIEHAEIRRCSVHAGPSTTMSSHGILLECFQCSFSGSVEENEVEGTDTDGIRIVGMSAGIVSGNRVIRFAQNSENVGIRLSGSDSIQDGSLIVKENSVLNEGTDTGFLLSADEGGLVARNTIGGVRIGVYISSGSRTALLEGNVISGAYETGISVLAASCTVRGNRVTGTGQAGSMGINLVGLHNLAEENSVQGYGTGIQASGTSNYYRNNFLTNNTYSKAGGTDGGGNIP